MMTGGSLPYERQSLRYLENAQEFLERDEPEKTGELLWGALAEALKAVAARGDRLVRSHRELWSLARVVATELGDESIYDAFVQANALHSNFYEAEISIDDIRVVAPKISATIERLLRS
jgi:hypothetical protein